jgi:hypothetical protein
VFSTTVFPFSPCSAADNQMTSDLQHWQCKQQQQKIEVIDKRVYGMQMDIKSMAFNQKDTNICPE